MPPKKQARNAFWFFMRDWKMREEAKGRVFQDGYRDVQSDPECNAEWRGLPPSEREVYTAKAKKAKQQGLAKGKQTGTGESVLALREEEQAKQDFLYSMDAHIRHTLSEGKKYKTIPSLTFIFVHTNWYYMREPDSGPVDFCPAEFAFAEFSLEEGVKSYYHEIIKTKLFPGYTREAMETSEKTHRLHWNLPFAEGDWGIMYYKLMDFLKPHMHDGKPPPFYAGKKIEHVVPSLLRRIAGEVGKTEDMFLLYTVEALFAEMLKSTTDFTESNKLAVIAETQFFKEPFAYTPNIECEFHKMHDGSGPFCSLSVVRQWAFTICDHCCKPLDVDMIPGVHCPERFDMKPKAHDTSYHSLLSDRSISVLSATGVSERHRISVSERSRDEEARRRRGIGTVEIIDHSLIENKKPVIEPEPIGVPVAPVSSFRRPLTASQAVVGSLRQPPIFNGENFPVIGGRGMALKRTENRTNAQVWSLRERETSDSD